MARAAWGRGRASLKRPSARRPAYQARRPADLYGGRQARRGNSLGARRVLLARLDVIARSIARSAASRRLHGAVSVVSRFLCSATGPAPGGALRGRLYTPPPGHLLQLCSRGSTVHHGPIHGRRLNKPSSKPV